MARCACRSKSSRRCRVRASRQEIGDAPIANDDEKSFGDRMLQGYAVRVVELRVAAPRLARHAVRASGRRARSPGCRSKGTTTVTNLRHEPVELPELPRRMLTLLDGTRDFEALVADIVEARARRQDRSARAGRRPRGHRPREARPDRCARSSRTTCRSSRASRCCWSEAPYAARPRATTAPATASACRLPSSPCAFLVRQATAAAASAATSFGFV